MEQLNWRLIDRLILYIINYYLSYYHSQYSFIRIIHRYRQLFQIQYLLINPSNSINIIIFCDLIMKEGTRLDYIVPGYTGHIPKKVYPEFQPIEKQMPRYQIPGYSGYVQAIKPQNLHAKTFGKLTYNISIGNYLKGQNHPVQNKYASTHTQSHIAPSSMLQRTAADIVGVPSKKIEVIQPNLQKKTGSQIDQYTLTKTWKQTGQNFNKLGTFENSTLVEKNGKTYVELGDPLPGYTGFNKRVLANNLFGKTYAECRKDAKENDQKIQQNRNKNYEEQLNSDPPMKY